jgi:hypothetical protein
MDAWSKGKRKIEDEYDILFKELTYDVTKFHYV